MAEIKITKLQIEIGQTILTLSLEEAKELKKILNDTFPEKTFAEKYFPVPLPSYPCRPMYPTTYWATGYASSDDTLGIKAK